MIKYILILIISINSCLAIDITPVKKGDSVPEDGFFVSKDEMKKFRQINEEKKLLEEKTITLKDLAVVNEKRMDIYKDHAIQYQKLYIKEQNKGNLKGIGGFLLGVVLTGAISYATVRTLK